MVSKFKLLPIFIAIYITALPFLVIYLSFISSQAAMFLPVFFLLFIVAFWLTVFRVRANKVKIENKVLTVIPYFGFGKSKIYDFEEIKKFVNLFETGKLGVSESIFIMKEEKRIACISDFYHSNFDELKKVLKTKVVYAGEIKGDFKREISEIFK